MVSSYIFTAIVLAGLVTWIARVLPYILVKFSGLPAIVEHFLKYLPISIIFALILSSLFKGRIGAFPEVKVLELLVVLPTFYLAFRYRNLLASVIFGVVLLAVLRFFFSF